MTDVILLVRVSIYIRRTVHTNLISDRSDGSIGGRWSISFQSGTVGPLYDVLSSITIVSLLCTHRCHFKVHRCGDYIRVGDYMNNEKEVMDRLLVTGRVGSCGDRLKHSFLAADCLLLKLLNTRLIHTFHRRGLLATVGFPLGSILTDGSNSLIDLQEVTDHTDILQPYWMSLSLISVIRSLKRRQRGEVRRKRRGIYHASSSDATS